MKKVGRNDPCPCGSGKKYKKCHGASNVIQLDPAIYDTELENLQLGLMEFATYYYENEIAEVLIDFSTPDFMDDEEIFQSYMANLTTWAVFQVPINNGDTIFDLYYLKKQQKIKREKLKKVFASWANVLPSIYEVISDMEEYANLKDIRTGETYEVIRIGEHPFEEGDILAGTLLPYVQRYAFFFSALAFHGVLPELKDQIQHTSDEEIIKTYPEILQKLLTPEEFPDEIAWDNPLYEMVAAKVHKNMERKEASETLIDTAILIWKLFTSKEYPTFRKIGSYAAAVEYVLQREILPEPLQSQQSLAEEYGISVTTLVKNAGRITEALDDELEDIYLKMRKELIDANEEFLESPEFSMEKTMRDIRKVMENKEFETEEEMHAFLDNYLNGQDFIEPVPESPRDIAQDMLFEAYGASGSKRRELIQEALKIHPNSPDSYILMAKDAKTKNEQYQLYHQAVVVGEKDLGKDFFDENEGHFWLMTETRPYMRAKAAFADFQYHFGYKDGAMQSYEEMLKLNPGDNQGVRYFLLTIYMEEKKFDLARELIEQYDDGSAFFEFNRALLQYHKEGVTKQTLKILQEADDDNPFVRDYILDDFPIPTQKPEYIGIGDETEAIAYVQENIHLWQDADELVEAWRRL